MSWRLQVNHTTGYHYSGEVLSSYNEARITPLTDTDQLTIDSAVDISPAARAYRYWDYWGCLVHAFDVHVPHERLVVTGRSLVETSESAPGDTTASWADLASEEVAELHHELLAPTAYVPFIDDRVRAQADKIKTGQEPHDAAMAASTWVHDTLTYQRGVTRVSTSAVEAWDHEQGVCQDFAHLTLALLRAMRIPSRYVSGYLHPHEDAVVGKPFVGESHAWVEWWAGSWVRFDPTNAIPAGHRHVVVGRGRDYADVVPLKGIYSGAPPGDLEVSVELTRVS